jgi:hypothetical protein
VVFVSVTGFLTTKDTKVTKELKLREFSGLPLTAWDHIPWLMKFSRKHSSGFSFVTFVPFVVKVVKIHTSTRYSWTMTSWASFACSIRFSITSITAYPLLV